MFTASFVFAKNPENHPNLHEQKLIKGTMGQVFSLSPKAVPSWRRIGDTDKVKLVLNLFGAFVLRSRGLPRC